MNKNDMSYFAGIICGDGYVSPVNYIIEIKSVCIEFLEKVYTPLIKRIFNLTPKIIPSSTSEITYRCYFYSVQGIRLLKSWNIVSPKTYTVAVPMWILKSSINTQINFVQGVMDTDGTISTKVNKSIVNYPTVALQSRSKKLVENVFEILIKTGINAKKGNWNKRGSPMFMVRMYGFKQLKEYMNKVSFKHPLKFKKASDILNDGVLRADRSIGRSPPYN